ncbi:MAG TPA: ABC transporter ATP-binding protein [Lichenihabitans sp.]|jgi:ABC-type sugar transport system ATPase subunit|nr:ABC transporter ATP-binding protein [Lichenihabitans sp.]
MAEILIDRVTKRFGTFTAVKDLEIRFADGEVACLLGPSGCGKTTLMRMIAGLETPTSGRILFGNRDVTALSTSRRNVGMVFQYPVMYPTLSVEENIALPMRQDRGISAAERDRRVAEMLDVLDMRDQRGRFIDELDAGNRQKVAVGRAVARGSDIVLFDEPTTNVEVNAKLQLIRAIKTVIQRTRQTIVYVTHDQTEAMTLADRIALMDSGDISQYDRPDQLYSRPMTEFGGWFLGNPGMNFVPATVANGTLAAAVLAEPIRLAQAVPPGVPIKLGIRPEWLDMYGEPRPGTVAGVLSDQTIGIAGRYLTKVSFGGVDVKIKTAGRPPAALGQTVHVKPQIDRILLYAGGNRITG